MFIMSSWHRTVVCLKKWSFCRRLSRYNMRICGCGNEKVQDTSNYKALCESNGTSFIGSESIIRHRRHSMLCRLKCLLMITHTPRFSFIDGSADVQTYHIKSVFTTQLVLEKAIVQRDHRIVVRCSVYVCYSNQQANGISPQRRQPNSIGLK